MILCLCISEVPNKNKIIIKEFPPAIIFGIEVLLYPGTVETFTERDYSNLFKTSLSIVIYHNSSFSFVTFFAPPKFIKFCVAEKKDTN